MTMLKSALRRARAAWRHVRVVGAGRALRRRPVPGGFTMELDLGDVFDQSLWFGAYEPHLRAVIEALVARGDTCVDIGTHKGFFTLLLARRVGPTGAVLAADPDPRAFSAMTANVRANGFAQVRPHQLAIADGPGHCSFQLTSQLGWSSRFPNAIASARVFEQVTVDTAALDALLAREELPRPGSTLSFVKIDAEGSEPLILRGMQETLERHRPTLHLEINVDSLRVAGETPASVLQPLAARGYGVFEIVWSRDRWLRPRTSLRRLDVATMARSADVICIHHASERGRRLLARFTR